MAMVDELERLRELRERAPGPDRSWVDDTRHELLAMADEEAPADAPPAAAFTWLQRFIDRLTVAFRRPAVVAAAALLLVGAVGVGVWQLTGQRPADRMATRPDATEATDPSSPSSPTAPPAGSQTQLAATCSAPDGSYTVAYPDDWHVNAGDQTDGCQVFDPQPVELEEGIGGAPLGAITIRTVPTALETIREPGRSARVLSEEEVAVSGDAAVRQILEHTGEGALPEGVRAYRYLVDLDERTLLAVTYDGGEPSFERRQQILDDMMGSLQLDPAD